MTPVKWTFSGSITGGPALSATDTLDATAYDRASVDIDNDGKWVKVELAPAVPDTLLLLIIKADPPSDQVTFKVNADTGTELRLNRPQVFSGAAGLLSANPVERLLFKNAGAAAVNIDITMARYATAPPAAAAAPAEDKDKGSEGGGRGEGADAAAPSGEAPADRTPVAEPPATGGSTTAAPAGEAPAGERGAGTGTTGTAAEAGPAGGGAESGEGAPASGPSA